LPGATVLLFTAPSNYAPAQEAIGKFDCVDCGSTVHSWAGHYNYLEWKTVTHATVVVTRD